MLKIHAFPSTRDTQKQGIPLKNKEPHWYGLDIECPYKANMDR